MVGGLALTGILVYEAYGLADALLSVGSWYYRYYSGGSQNARTIALRKIEHETHVTYRRLLDLVDESKTGKI